MVQNPESQLEHKQEACPEGIQPKSLQEIREETENKLGTTNQEIEDRLCNLKAKEEKDKHIEEKFRDAPNKAT